MKYLLSIFRIIPPSTIYFTFSVKDSISLSYHFFCSRTFKNTLRGLVIDHYFIFEGNGNSFFYKNGYLPLFKLCLVANLEGDYLESKEYINFVICPGLNKLFRFSWHWVGRLLLPGNSYHIYGPATSKVYGVLLVNGIYSGSWIYSETYPDKEGVEEQFGVGDL
jgi:hypothetical protein